MPDDLQFSLDNETPYVSPQYEFKSALAEAADQVSKKLNVVKNKLESIPIDFKAIGEVALRSLFIGGGVATIVAAFIVPLPTVICIGIGILGYLAIGIGARHYDFAPLNGRDFHFFKQPNC